MSFAFEPCVAGDFAAALVAHAKDDPRWYSVARKIAVKHGGAFPAHGREDQKVTRKQSIDRACEIVLIRVAVCWLFCVPRDDLKRTR